MSTTPRNRIEWQAKAHTDSKPIVKVGLWAIMSVLVVFLLWGSLASLSSAIITPGVVVSEGSNKLVQHPIGGRVLSIAVRDGDGVTAGDVMVVLDPSKAQAELARLEARHTALMALRSRLDAERSNDVRPMNLRLASEPEVLRGVRPEVAPKPPVALRGGDGTLLTVVRDEPVAAKPAAFAVATQDRELLESQRDAYDSGRALLAQEIQALNQKRLTLKSQMAGLAARIDSQNQLLEITGSEIQRLTPLAAAGYVARNRIADKRRTQLELEGLIASLRLDRAAMQDQMTEIALQIDKARIARADAASRDYARIVSELAELEDQRRVALDAVNNLALRAPASGDVINMKLNTVGGVFGPGDVIAEIVPEGAPLQVEVRIQPSDIDFVKIGQVADIAVTAFDRRLDDLLEGEVVYVSADSEKDPDTGAQYFTARLDLAELQDPSARLPDIKAGMQGEVYIHTGSRTFLTYLTRPLLDSFRRAFRER